MYMAGRALFPLSIHVARLLTDEFQGKLRISYSGGATIENIKELFDAGIWPITMATNILKPGGYQRMSQIADELWVRQRALLRRKRSSTGSHR